MRGTPSRLDRSATAAYAELSRSVTAWPGYPDARPVQFVPVPYQGRSVQAP